MTPFTRALEGGTLVVVGLGSIGRSVARKARAFEMRVVGVSRQGRSAPYCERVVPHTQLREVLPEADALVLALPLTEETFQLLGRNELALMKPGAVVVNSARGGLIDEPALIEALQQGRIGGAGLDVVESEPLAPDSPLWGMHNVLLTPHIGGRGGVEQDHRLAAFLADNLRRFQAGRELRGNFGLYFLRDKTGREVDFLVAKDDKPWFIVELKSSSGRDLNPALEYFQTQTRAGHAFQVVFRLPFVARDCFEHTSPLIVPAATFLSQLV